MTGNGNVLTIFGILQASGEKKPYTKKDGSEGVLRNFVCDGLNFAQFGRSVDFAEAKIGKQVRCFGSVVVRQGQNGEYKEFRINSIEEDGR